MSAGQEQGLGWDFWGRGALALASAASIYAGFVLERGGVIFGSAVSFLLFGHLAFLRFKEVKLSSMKEVKLSSMNDSVSRAHGAEKFDD